MFRSVLIVIVVGLVAVTTGCRMCAHPFDYSGPVLDGTCDGQADCGCDTCDGQAGGGGRAGSILSGGMHPSVISQPVAHTQPTPATVHSAAPRPIPTASGRGNAAGNVTAGPEFGIDPKLIISVTDRKVEEVQQD